MEDSAEIQKSRFPSSGCYLVGWVEQLRLGWLVLPPELVQPVERLAQNLFISPSTIAQHAALGAFDDQSLLDRRIATYRRNRDTLVAALTCAGLPHMAPPDGAFYLYVDVSAITLDSVSLCRELLEATGVAVTPGLDFDEDRGHRFIRLSFAGEPASVDEAAGRLERYLHGRSTRQSSKGE